MIAIVDYGMGNLFSVSKALDRLGEEYVISSNPKELLQADGLILPGVGSFKDAMTLLHKSELVQAINGFVKTDKPLLGICLGMQLLFEESDENGKTEGLGLIPGSIVRIPTNDQEGNQYKVPHMGWNRLSFQNPSRIVYGLEENHVYFVHSYYLSKHRDDNVIASSIYGVEVPAIVEKGNVFGMQFHPEKSGKLGMQLLENFTKIVKATEVIS